MQLRSARYLSRLLRAIPALRQEGKVHEQGHPGALPAQGPEDDFRHFRKVSYTETRPTIFLSDSTAVEFFYFKSKEWEYEQEWRLIIPLKDCSHRSTNGTGLPICLFAVPPSCITAVAVGVRMPESQKFELTKELRTNEEFRHVRVEQVDLDPHVFALHRRVIQPDELDNWIVIATGIDQRTRPNNE